MHQKITREDKTILAVRLFVGSMVVAVALTVGISQFIAALHGALVVLFLDYVAIFLINRASGARQVTETVKGFRLGLRLRLVLGIVCLWVVLVCTDRSYGMWFLASYVAMAVGVLFLPMVFVMRDRLGGESGRRM